MAKLGIINSWKENPRRMSCLGTPRRAHTSSENATKFAYEAYLLSDQVIKCHKPKSHSSGHTVCPSHHKLFGGFVIFVK